MQTEATGSRWMPMREAAVLIGVSERGARDWVRRHAIPTRGERPVLVDGEALTTALLEIGRSPRKGSGSASEPIDAAFRVDGVAYDPRDTPVVPTSTVVEQGRAFAEKLAELAQRNEALALEVGMLRERTEQQAVTLDGERERRERAERERDALQARLDAANNEIPVETASVRPEPSSREIEASAPRRGIWSALLAALRGERSEE